MLLNVLHELIESLRIPYRFLDQHIPKELSVRDVELQCEVYGLSKVRAVVYENLNGLFLFANFCEKVGLLFETPILVADLHCLEEVDMLSFKKKSKQVFRVKPAVEFYLSLVIVLADFHVTSADDFMKNKIHQVVFVLHPRVLWPSVGTVILTDLL